MAVLERRLQLLLDEQRYARVAEEATRRGASVATVIRDAIDLAYPSGYEVRVQSVRNLLASADGEPADLDDAAWRETREAMEAELVGRFA
ncbi:MULTISPECIES: hypothetical protein [unclassified Luteococcus]|uniref:hypothetical protein n=1 Tax=unclassified Luteococcus TaxID=2639923 RepID=UPI00313C0758